MNGLLRVKHAGLILVLAIVWTLPGCGENDAPSEGTALAPVTAPVSADQCADGDGLTGTPDAESAAKDAESPQEADMAAAGPLVAIDLELPPPAFRGTPVPLDEPNVEKPTGKPREPFLAPEGTINLARGRLVSSSDPAPSTGELDSVTDGHKEATDFGLLQLRPGTEWIQIDLGQKASLYAVLVWHNHAQARVYRDVIVQISDDPDFLEATAVFNNDCDNSSGLGIGRDRGYVETSEGKLIDCKGIVGRYVRFYSWGNHLDDKNHYTEIAVYGKPAAQTIRKPTL